MSMNKPEFDDAAAIIQKFGGIRPMSSKTNIPVTTIQGWKKRGTIPKTRRDEIMAFATQNDIDLTGSLDLKEDQQTPSMASLSAKKHDSAANENKTAIHKISAHKKATHVPRSVNMDQPTSEAIIKKAIKNMEHKTTLKTILISALFASATAAFLVFLFNPATNSSSADKARILELERKIEKLEARQSESSAAIIPENLAQDIEKMQDQMLIAIDEVKQNSGAFLKNNVDQLQDRIFDIEDTLAAMTTAEQRNTIRDWRSRLLGLFSTQAGKVKIQTALRDLSNVLSDIDIKTVQTERVDSVLEGARAQSSALSETMDGVPVQDLKAAAMLLAMTQFRDSLNRDNQPFNNDMTVLKSLVSEDDIELQEALDKLAPYARSGILTPSGLTNEFKSLSGDVVIASLKGEDVSITERTTARINKLFQIEKDGELVTGTPTQTTLNSAENKLAQNDIQGAIVTLGNLEGPAAKLVRPWIAKAQATIAAEKMKIILNSGRGR